MKVATNSVFDYEHTIIGGGEVIRNTHTVTLSSAANTDKAYIARFVAVRGGTRVTVRATARCLGQPETGKEMKLAMDNYKQGLVNQVVINSTDWKTYEISTVIPYDKTWIVSVKAVIGAWFNQIASIEVSEFDVFVENTGFAAARVHAMGIVDLIATGVKLNATGIAIGMRDVLYQDGVLTIQTDNLLNVNSSATSPIFTAQLQASVKCPVLAYISSFDRATGVVKIKFADLKTGENVNITQAPYTDGGNKFSLHFTSLF